MAAYASFHTLTDDAAFAYDQTFGDAFYDAFGDAYDQTFGDEFYDAVLQFCDESYDGVREITLT